MEEILYYVMQFSVIIIQILVILFFLRILFLRGIKFFHSHWNTLINSFEYSTEEFYKRYKKELLSHGVSGVTTASVSLREGNIFSNKRRYLRIKWKEFQYDICAAPFGDGFFVSWWLLDRATWIQVLISLIPFIGRWLIRKLYPTTYYKIDTASMMMRYCHQTALRVIDDITDGQGVRKMTEDERKPILNDIFNR